MLFLPLAGLLFGFGSDFGSSGASHNSSIIETKDLTKRDAEAGWMRLRLGQPLKKRDADADADAGWMRLSPGKPMKKREADADAEAGWMRLRIGQPL